MASTRTPHTALSARLAERTLQLVDIASVSGAERDIAAHLLRVLRDGGVPARDAGDTCVLAGRTGRSERPLVLLVGHLDTVPAQGNWPGRCTGEVVLGVGACDMKGGVAVLLEAALAGAREARERALDVGYVLFGREELPCSQSALAPLLEREPWLQSADLAIVLEPTANVVQAGCLGNLDAMWRFHGRAGHSARPWLADNAIDHAANGISALHAVGPSPRTIGGLDFTQVVSVTMLHAGVAHNVIPGECTANVNFRYAPATSEAEAERELRALCEPHGELRVVSNTGGAMPPHENPLVHALAALSGVPIEPKQAWTPVAEFAAAGIDAVNLGPGDPAFAHSAGEHVSIHALTRAYEILETFLCG